MKKYQTIMALILVLGLLLTGCGGGNDKPADPVTPDQTENNASQEPEPVQPEEPAPSADPVQPAQSDYQSSLMDKIPFSVDMGLGWEFCDLNVNGAFRRVAAQFEMDSSVIPTDPCFTYYYVDIHGDDLSAEVVAVGRAFLNDATTEFIRETEDLEELAMINFELFEYDFNASAFKGKDKEYIVFSIPASWEPDTATLVIATDQGKLLADSTVDKSYPVTLSGDDAEKYLDSNGNANFFSFSEDEITYLEVSDRVDGVTHLREYSLVIENDRITSVETGNIYQTTDMVPDLPGISIY